MEKPVATLAILCARPDGLVPVLECAANQIFDEPFEVLVVDWGFGEREELVRALWNRLRLMVPLRHVPPLPPLHDCYGSWEMGTTYNTAWAHALGEVFVCISDFWVFGADWLSTHVKAVREAPGAYCLGVNHAAEPAFDVAARAHYNAPGAVIMENFSHKTACAWAGGGLGAPEWPTRHPESTILPHVFGTAPVCMVPRAHAWHLPHYADGNFGHVMQKTPFDPTKAYYNPDGSAWDGRFRYYDVKFMSNPEAYGHAPPADGWQAHRRNLVEARQKLGYWV